MFHQKACVYGRRSIMKIMRPMICQKLFAGFATDTSSTTTEFQRSLPTKPRITNARRNAKRIERNSTYASRFHAIRTTDFSLLKSVQDKFLVRSSVTTDESGHVQVTHTGTAFVVNSSGQVVSELPFGIGPDGMENDFTVLLNNIENGDK